MVDSFQRSCFIYTGYYPPFIDQSSVNIESSGIWIYQLSCLISQQSDDVVAKKVKEQLKEHKRKSSKQDVID